MILTIAGTPGSGKSTIAKLLQEKLSNQDFKLIDVGILRRNVAKKMNMTIEEFNNWSKDNPVKGDKQFDEETFKEVQRVKNAIVVGRMAFFTIPQSIKIFIDVDITVGAKRIFIEKETNNKRNEGEIKSIEEQIKKNKERIEIDISRYNKIYNINPYDKKHFDLVIDSTKKTPEEIVNLILAKI